MEVAILLMIYTMKYLFQTKAKDENLSFFTMIAKINEAKTLTNVYHTNINVNFMVENLTQIKSGITINVGMNIKIRKMCAKKVMLGYLYLVRKYYWYLVITCDEIVEVTKNYSNKYYFIKNVLTKVNLKRRYSVFLVYIFFLLFYLLFKIFFTSDKLKEFNTRNIFQK